MSNLSPEILESLQTELLRVTSQRGEVHQFTALDGTRIQGATESDVIKHLTSRHDHASGRQFRFPGIGNGWVFSDSIESAGFRTVRARNFRNQICTVITL